MTGRGLPLELAGVAELCPVALDDLVEAADLQRRYDAKYLVEVGRLPAIVDALGPRMRALEVDGQRTVAYHTVYFDTPDLRTYRDHLRRRRRRFKVRTRHYGDPAGALLEVKAKGEAGRTLKYRVPHPHGAAVDDFGSAAERVLDEVLAGLYGWRAPGDLRPVAVTGFDRTTLADLARTERVTIDRMLTVEVEGRREVLGAGYAIVEVKSPTRRGAATAALLELGLRPRSLSKYCLALAAQHEGVRGNPWLPTLRRLRAVGDDAVDPLAAASAP